MSQKTIIFTKIYFRALKQVTISSHFITLIVLDYGAIIQKLLVKDAKGSMANVVVGHDFPAQYLDDNMSLGACIGRYAGRISKGAFTLDREKYLLYQEDGVHLHGGKEGFGKKYWTFEEVGYGDEPFITLAYTSKHLEEGYPGNLKVTVTYKIQNNVLHIIHRASTDRTTVVNLTNHTYFKLDDTSKIHDYQLQLNCLQWVVTDDKLLPTGEFAPVAGTSYDFTIPKPLGSIQLDTPFVIDPSAQIAAKIYSPKSRISMEVKTNQPGMVVFTAPHIPSICFETQNFPDAPNFSHFPNCVLKPGEVYENSSQFVFDIE